MKNIDKFFSSIVIYDCGLTKQRLGRNEDGGYVVLNELCQGTNTLYSFGAGDDVSFEVDFIGRFPEAKVKVSDPNVRGLPKGIPEFTFDRYGIGEGYGTLTGVAPNSILKMDIEWNEWSAFLMLSHEELKKFTQVIAEFHIITLNDRVKGKSPYFTSFYGDVIKKVNEQLFRTYSSVMSKLSEDFYLFHAHANNSLPPEWYDGYCFPPLIEMSFVRKDLIFQPKVADISLPVEGIDYPNKKDRPDIVGWYPFERKANHG